MVFLESLRGVTTTFLVIAGAFRAMDPSLEEAAKVSGISNRTTFFRVFLPLLTPAILAAGIYTFMSHLESLEIPLIIGFPARIYVFSTYIYFTTQRFTPPEYGLSASLSSSFLLVSLILVYWYRWVVGEAERYATITGRGYRPRVIPLGKWRYPAFGLFLLYFLLIVALPTLALIWRSLLRYYVPPSWGAHSRITLEHYREIFTNEDIVRATANTITMATSAATLIMVLSLIVAWVIIRKRFRGRSLLDAISFLPHALPGVIIAIALIFLYVRPPLSYLQLYGTLWTIILGLTVSYIAFGSRTMNAAVTQIHVELEEAGKVSGATWMAVMRRITFPLLLPAFAGGWIWVAAHSLRSFSIPLMLTTQESKVLSVIIWSLWDSGFAGEATALGVVVILAITIFTTGGRWLVSRASHQQLS